MKVERNHDLHKTPRLEPPVVEKPAQVKAQVDASAFGRLSSDVSQEVAQASKPLMQRSMGVLATPTEQLAQLYDQLGHPAQTSLSTLTREIRQQLKHQPSIEKLLTLTGGGSRANLCSAAPDHSPGGSRSTQDRSGAGT